MKVLVTGADGVIGKEISDALSKKFSVVRTDVTQNCTKLDVTNEKDVKLFFDSNDIDAVVHSAYPRTDNWGLDFFDVSNELFCKNISLQLGGAFNVLKHSCDHFRKKNGGTIVMLGSVSGVMNPRFDTYEDLKMTTPVAYSCIKSGLISLSAYAAKYLKGENIRINIVSPSGIFDNQNEVFVERYKKYCLNKGMLDASDLTGAVSFLLSEDSKYINGQNLIVDDGFTL